MYGMVIEILVQSFTQYYPQPPMWLSVKVKVKVIEFLYYSFTLKFLELIIS